MATTEHTMNDAIAHALRSSRHGWHADGVVRSENTGTVTGSNRRPDILIVEPGVSPVVIETEVMPANTVEPEARSRLGETLRENGHIMTVPYGPQPKGKVALGLVAGMTERNRFADGLNG